MQILGLLGMYFDAVVVEVNIFFTFIQIGSGRTVVIHLLTQKKTKVFTNFVRKLVIQLKSMTVNSIL